MSAKAVLAGLLCCIWVALYTSGWWALVYLNLPVLTMVLATAITLIALVVVAAKVLA